MNQKTLPAAYYGVFNLVWNGRLLSDHYVSNRKPDPFFCGNNTSGGFMRYRRFPATLTMIGLTLLLGILPTPRQGAAQEALWGNALIHKIDSLAEATMTGGPVAGLGIGVKRGDDLLMVRGYGSADIENGVPVTAETVFRIGSVTKQFTASAVMQLVEEGKIGLDDPVTEYLPDYPTQGHEVTVRHLLTHTSGIKSYTGLESWRPKMTLDLTDEELVALFKDEPFDFAPGERYQYNNSGFYLLGLVIEKASGETYREYLNGHLFGPLDLSGSSYCDERPIIPGRAEGYERVDGELVNDAYLSMNQPGAAGALCSTVPDLLSWTAALRAGQVVSGESYEKMTTAFTLTEGSTTGYGFGLGVGEFHGHPIVSHGGGINGFASMMSHYSDMDLDVVVLSNTAGPHTGQVAETIAGWALGIDAVVVKDEPLSAEELSVYEGVYQIRPEFELSVQVRDGQLFSQATGQGGFRLKAQGAHRFIPTFDDNVLVVFTVDDGRATSLTLHQGGQTIEASRVR
jgi:D-alanyl-D-alanine carboxypeptidase